MLREAWRRLRNDPEEWKRHRGAFIIAFAALVIYVITVCVVVLSYPFPQLWFALLIAAAATFMPLMLLPVVAVASVKRSFRVFFTLLTLLAIQQLLGAAINYGLAAHSFGWWDALPVILPGIQMFPIMVLILHVLNLWPGSNYEN